MKWHFVQTVVTLQPYYCLWTAKHHCRVFPALFTVFLSQESYG